jgi:hypothetical protein
VGVVDGVGLVVVLVVVVVVVDDDAVGLWMMRWGCV